MLHHGEKNHVSFAYKLLAPSLSDEIDALSRSTRENDFLGACGADVLRDALPAVFVSFGRARAQRVQPTMDICVVVLVKLPKRLDDGARFLRSRRAIEVDQRMAVGMLAENRKILANSFPVDSAGCELVHTLI